MFSPNNIGFIYEYMDEAADDAYTPEISGEAEVWEVYILNFFPFYPCTHLSPIL